MLKIPGSRPLFCLLGHNCCCCCCWKLLQELPSFKHLEEIREMLGIFHIISLYLELIIRPPQKCKDPLNFSYFQKGDTSCYGQLTKCKRALTSLLISPQKLHNDANIPINLVQKQKNLNIPAQSENWTQKRQFFPSSKALSFLSVIGGWFVQWSGSFVRKCFLTSISLATS